MNFRSYTQVEIKRAIELGDEAWALDTGNDGEDDVIIGTKEECERDILYLNDLDKLPDHWTLNRYYG